MGHRHRADPDLCAHDHRAGPLVDESGEPVHRDVDADLGHELHHPVAVPGGDLDAHEGRILGLRDLAVEDRVDGVRHPRRRREVGIVDER